LLKTADVMTATTLCAIFHQRHDNFFALFLPLLLKNLPGSVIDPAGGAAATAAATAAVAAAAAAEDEKTYVCVLVCILVSVCMNVCMCVSVCRILICHN
jgi:hypothetical protein